MRASSLLKSPGLSSVFWPILIKLQFEWSPLVLVFSNPSVLVPILWWLYQEHQLQLVSPSLSCSTVFFNSLASSRYLSFFLLTFNFSLCQPGHQSPQFGKFSFFIVDYYKVWLSNRNWMIRLYLKIPEEFAHLILQGRFSVAHIPFVRMVKFQLLLLSLLLYFLRVFHTNINWWFFAGVCLTASLRGSPELFSVFWPISTNL